MCDGAELDIKLLVGRRDQLAVRTLHRAAHRARKIRDSTRPFALSYLHFIGMINQMIVGERLEKFDGLRLVICLLYTSPSPRDRQKSRMPSSA